MIKKRFLCLLMAVTLTLPAAAAPLEFSQVSDLVAAGNRQIAMNALTLAVLQSNGTVADAQNNIYQLSGGLSSLAANLQGSGDAIGVAAGNGLSLTAQYTGGTWGNTDIDGNGSKNAIDVQLVVNSLLGLSTPFNADVDGNGVVNAVDVQRVVNAVLGVE